MAAKNPQNEPVEPAKMPSHFADDLAQRCFPYRFRKVGSPYAYLNEVGIYAIVEYISKGHLLIDVAEAVNVPLQVLRTWVEQEGHVGQIEEAETLSADGYLAEGMKRIRNAQTEFELRRAEKMVRHAQFMASKKNKPVYGEQIAKQASAPVQYIFNIPGTPANNTIPKFAGQIIDATANRTINDTAEAHPVSVSLDLGQAFGIATDTNEIFQPMTNDMLAHLATLDDAQIDALPDDGPRLVLVADRPVNPTPDNPDVGPFFDEVVP